MNKKKPNRKQTERDLSHARSMLEHLMPRAQWLESPPALGMKEASIFYDWFKNGLLDMIASCEAVLNIKSTI